MCIFSPQSCTPISRWRSDARWYGEQKAKAHCAAVNDNTNPATSAFLVERIEIGKWPYGSAWGRFVRNGVPEAPEQLRNAGSYQWRFTP